MALDAKYHLACLAGLRNRHRSFIRQNQDSHSSHTEDLKTQARAFVELITYVENAVENGTFCFKFSLLRQLYESRLHILGIDKEINKVRFKKQVLEYFTNAQEHQRIFTCLITILLSQLLHSKRIMLWFRNHTVRLKL